MTARTQAHQRQRRSPRPRSRFAHSSVTERSNGIPPLVQARTDVGSGARILNILGSRRVRDIRALCTMLPARVSLAGRPLELETRLLLRDRGVTTRITLRQRWRCVRDRMGEFGGIQPIAPRPLAARPGLAVRLSAPRVVGSGRRATVLVTVANQRRSRPSRVVSSLGTCGSPAPPALGPTPSASKSYAPGAPARCA